MQIKGKIIEIYDTVAVNDKFRKREFVVEYAENQYPELIKFQLVQDNCDALNTQKIGDNVEVTFDLKGRVWTNPKGEKVYFTTLQAWKIGRISAGSPKQTNDFGAHDVVPEPGDEDLPF